MTFTHKSSASPWDCLRDVAMQVIQGPDTTPAQNSISRNFNKMISVFSGLISTFQAHNHLHGQAQSL
jgi:hypothetical protein